MTALPATSAAKPTRHLSNIAVLGILALTLAVSGGLLAALGTFSIPAFVALGALLFVPVLYVLSRVIEGPRHATNRVMTAIVTGFFLLALIPLISIVWTVVSNGYSRIDPGLFTKSMKGVLDLSNDSTQGGARHAIMGTLIITGLTALISVPLGLLAAIYLVEYGAKSRMAKALTFFVDVMTGIPSIVAGLFAVALFAVIAGPAYRAGIMGVTALTLLMTPVVVRSAEEMLRLVPHELREASYALGVPKWRTILKVVLPTSIAGITTGIMLAIARVIGETAPLLITTGLTAYTNTNPFNDRMTTLPVFALDQYSSATTSRFPQAFLDRAWASLLVLIVLVMVLNLLARLISKLWAPKTGR